MQAPGTAATGRLRQHHDPYGYNHADVDANTYGDGDALQRQTYTYAKAAPRSCASPAALVLVEVSVVARLRR